VHPGSAARSGQRAHERARAQRADIRTLVREGDECWPAGAGGWAIRWGSSGGAVSTHVSPLSRYLVAMHARRRWVFLAHRIRDRAQPPVQLVATLAEQGVAMAHEGRLHRAHGRDGRAARGAACRQLFLQRLWAHVRERSLQTGAGNLVHEDLPPSTRVLRDELRTEVRRVLVDSPEEYARMMEFTRSFMPDYADRIELYQASRPIFDLHGIEDEINRALEARVPLKSGGHIVIQQTEAMTTVDVNTGGYVGHRNLEETIFRTNLEAAVTIARQLRVRNLGGIIVLDFIDMQDADHRQALLDALQAALAEDRAQTHIASVSPLGLVEMTRKRTRESLEHLLCSACPACQGRGFLRTPETVSHEIFHELMRQSRQFNSDELVVLAHQDVVSWLQEEESTVLAELETQVGRPIRLQAEPLYGIDQYDVVLA
jgi:ribonuclease G